MPCPFSAGASQLGLCLLVLYSENRTKEGHGKEKGEQKSYPTLQLAIVAKQEAKKKKKDNQLESTFTQLRSRNP